MDAALTTISTQGLIISLLPVIIVIGILFRWSAGAPTAIYATLRMLVQLLLIGYVLVFIFETELESWYIDKKLWPKKRSLKLFREWFTVECHTMIEDTVVGSPIEDE